MSTVKVFDPPMCCSTGVCGTEPDIALARFAADIQWWRKKGWPLSDSASPSNPTSSPTTPPF